MFAHWRSKQKYPSLIVDATNIEYNINNYGSGWHWINDNTQFSGYYLVPDLYHYYPYGIGYAGLGVIGQYRNFNI